MEIDGKKIVERYVQWLQDNIKFKNIDKRTISIDSPFLDRHNDYLRIYIRKTGEDIYYLTDDSFTLFDLESNGFSFTNTKKNIFDIFVNGQGIKFNEKTQELYVESNWEDLPQKKHDLIQAMINIDDMFVTSLPYVKSIFFEEVIKFFSDKDIPATPDIIVQGQGFKDKIDFVIPNGKERNEKLIKLVNNPQRGFYQRFLFRFIDIRNGKTVHAKSDQILFINNAEHKINKSDLAAIESYSVKPVLWSEREEKVEVFTK